MWVDESNQVHVKSLDSEAHLQLPKQQQALDMMVKEAQEIKARHARASTNALHSDPKLLAAFLMEIVNFMCKKSIGHFYVYFINVNLLPLETKKIRK